MAEKIIDPTENHVNIQIILSGNTCFIISQMRPYLKPKLPTILGGVFSES